MEHSIFERGKLSTTYLKLAMPVVFGMVISIIYNIADTFFIAQTQNTYLVAGVSLCGPIFTILMAFGNIFGQGGSSLLSRLLGQKESENMQRVSSFCFYIALIFGVVMMAIMLIFRTPLLYALGASEDTFRYAGDYYTVMAIGDPFVVLSFIHMNLLRCEGMSLMSTVGSVGGLLINIILDPILISFWGLGAKGAAIASVIGYIGTDLFLLIVVRKKSSILSVNPRLLTLPRNYISQIFSVGFSAALANWMTSLAMIILNHFLLPYGSDKIAAMGIAQKISMIIMLVVTGLAFGGAPMIGYFIGAQKAHQLRKLLRFMFRFISILALVMSAILILLAPLATGFFLKDPEIIREGTKMLRLQTATMVLTGIILVVTISFQAAGKAREAMILSLSRQGILYLVIIFIASAVAGYNGIIASQLISDILATILALVLFYINFYREYLVESPQEKGAPHE